MSKELSPQPESTLDRAIEETQRMPVPDPPASQLFLARIPNQRIPVETLSPQPRPTRRSFVMRYLVPCTAAALFAALAIGWIVVGSTASDALAEVIQATAKHKILRCNLYTFAIMKSKVRADKEEEFVPATNDEVVYFDLTAPRFRIELHQRTINDAVQSDWVTIQDNEQDKVLITSSLELVVTEEEARDETTAALIRQMCKDGDFGKKARLSRISVDGDGLRPFTHVKTDKTLLEILEAFRANKNVVSTKETCGGREVTKYHLEQDNMTSLLWVDAETMLPVRIEQELLNPQPNVRRLKWTYTHFQWDPDTVEADKLFSLQPPAGYTLEDHTNEE